MIYIVFHRLPTALYTRKAMFQPLFLGQGRATYWLQILAGSETDRSTFLSAQIKSNVEHKNSTDKLPSLRSSFFNIYGCLHSIFFLTYFFFFFKTCKSLVREENIAFDNDFAQLKNLGKENMARSHTKHRTEMRVLANAFLHQLNFTVLPNFYFFAQLRLNSCCLGLGAGVYFFLHAEIMLVCTSTPLLSKQ